MRCAIPMAVAGLALAGCLAPPPAAPPPVGSLAFDPPVAVSLEWPGAEPVLAMAPDGALYLEGIGRTERPPAGNVNKVWRSLDDGATWQDITPPALGQERSNDGYVAVDRDGTVWVANVFSLTFQVFRSRDQGATWDRVNVPNLPALMHRHWILPLDGTIHIALEALPPSFATFLGGVPPPAAQTGNPNEGLWYLRSDDNGATWTQPEQIDARVNFAGQSRMVASADGQRLYVARYTEDADPVAYTYDDGTFYLLASEDGGATWEQRPMFALPAEMSTAVPGLALGPDGQLWFATTFLRDGVSRLHLARSTDGGRTWGPLEHLALSHGTHAMAFVESAAAGEVAVMWYAADVAGNARELDAAWFVDAARITGAGTASARVAQARATPEAVHQGNICARGPACAAGEDRRLLDYPWMVVGLDGAMRLAYASTMWDQPSAFAGYVREHR